MQVTELWTEDLVIALSEQHPLAHEENPSLDELAQYPLLLPKRTEQILLHRVVEKAMVRSGLRLTFGAAVELDRTATAELLNHPDSWSILYASTAASTPKTGLVFRTEAARRLTLAVSAVVDRSLPATAVQLDLIDALTATAPESTAPESTAPEAN